MKRARETQESVEVKTVLQPIALLTYGLSVSTFALADRLREKGNHIQDTDDIRKAVVTIFEQIKKKTGVSLSIDWLPYKGLITERNVDLYETTFIHTLWHTTTGPGFGHIFIGESIEPEPEEKRAIDQFCLLTDLGKSVLDEAYKGFSLGVGVIDNKN